MYMYTFMHASAAVDCGMLDAPMFGDINFNETTFGSNATYTCQRGYTLNGTSVRVCGGDGQWSDSAPQCTRKMNSKHFIQN